MFFRKNGMRCTVAALALAGFAALAGCQRSNGRQAIDGTVTIDGRRVADALLHFQPLPGQSGNASGASTDAAGCFYISAAKGLLPGKYAVSIQKWEKNGRTFVDPRTKEVVDITEPIAFREEKSLSIAIVAGRRNHFDFQLTSVKKK